MLIKFATIFVLLASVVLLISFSNVYGDAEIKGNSAVIMFNQDTYPIPNEFQVLKISIRIFDPDFNTSFSGIDNISQDLSDEPGVGPVKISIIRGNSVVLGYAGGTSSNNGKLDSKPIEVLSFEKSQIKQLGPIPEISPTSGIFEFEVVIKNIDGPESSKCPISNEANLRFDDSNELSKHCILQGDVLLVEFTDPSDISGNPRTVTDSATFTLLNPSPYGSGSEKITASKTVRIGHPLTLLLYDSNLNLDNERAETYTLDLIQFESKNIRTTMGPAGGVQNEFNPQPSALRETGDDTGIFYTVIEVPRTVDGKRIDVNEKIEFEYTQRGLGAFLAIHQGTYSPKLTFDKQTEFFSINPENFSLPIFDDISCKKLFVKIYKYDNSPACVKPKTAEKLIERGWTRPNPW
jgi:hypothetical protein